MSTVLGYVSIQLLKVCTIHCVVLSLARKMNRKPEEEEEKGRRMKTLGNNLNFMDGFGFGLLTFSTAHR